MENTLLKQILERHKMDISALRLQRQDKENDLALRQAKFDLRNAQVAQTLYDGSFRSFWDRLSGKKEAKEVELRHEVQKKEANLTAAKRQREVLDMQLSEIREKLEAFPDWNDLRSQAEGETLREWYRLDALYCIEAVLPLLEDNHTALIEQRNMMSGANVGKVYTFSEQAEVYTAPEQIGDLCKPYILRLKTALDILQIPFDSYSYFQNPSAFINGVIAKHNRRDRVNEALNQVEALQRLLPQLQQRLEKI